MRSLRHSSIVSLTLACLSLLVAPFAGQAMDSDKPAQGRLDTKAIEQQIGKSGETKGDLYKISLPRTDLTVTVDGINVKPGFALGSWIAFKPAGNEAAVHGDLVLTEGEVAPVIHELEEHRFLITALHNHLIHESPRVMYLHFWGQGEPEQLARILKRALAKTKTPLTESKILESGSGESELNADQIQATLGQKGTLKDGVLKVSVPRPETITSGGVELPPDMGMATAMNFQGASDGQVVATGDFVMTGNEVNRVARALVEHGIIITALHNHLIHGSPDLFFMHFWAHDTPEKVARGLKAGLDAMKRG